MRKYFRYFWYLMKHKWFVFTECYCAGIVWRGLIHDLSKFLPDEFFPYAEYFYGSHSKDKVPYEIQYAFDIAWNKHQHRNDHHWQHWILKEDDGPTKILDMGSLARKEMICDWRGAGKAITGKDNTVQWYLKNKRKMTLARSTREIVEYSLRLEDLKGYDRVLATDQPFIYPSYTFNYF